MGKPKLIMKANSDSNDVSVWLKCKANHISGTDAGVIMGVNPWKTPYELYIEKLEAQKADKLESTKLNEAVYWGKILEEEVAKEFSKQMNYTLRKKGTLQDTECTYRIANIDREIIGENAGLECKTTSAFKKSDWEKGKIPRHYYYQCLHYMLVRYCDRSGKLDNAYRNVRWYIACLIGGQHYVHYEIPFKQDDAYELVEKENEFWELLQNKVPPMLAGAASEYGTLSQQIADDDIINLSNDALQEIKNAERLNEEIKERKEELLRCRNKIACFVGTHSKARCNNYIVTFSAPAQRENVNLKELKMKDPTLYETLTKRNFVKKTVGARVLRIKAVNEDVRN